MLYIAICGLFGVLCVEIVGWLGRRKFENRYDRVIRRTVADDTGPFAVPPGIDTSLSSGVGSGTSLHHQSIDCGSSAHHVGSFDCGSGGHH